MAVISKFSIVNLYINIINNSMNIKDKIKSSIIGWESKRQAVFWMQSIYWYLQFQHNAKKLKLRIYHGEHNPNYLRDTFVFAADGTTVLGGLADRIKGIMELYDWCQRNNYGFKVNFHDPFLLQDYLMPNEYDWTINKDQVSYHPDESEPVLLQRTGLMSQSFLKHEQTYYDWSMKLHSIRTHKQLHMKTHFALSSYNWAQRYHELFKPAPVLSERLEYYKQQIGGKYISISFRFTTLLGDLQDNVNSELPFDEKRILIERCKNEILKIQTENPEVEHFLVATDSITFIHSVENIPKVFVVPGEICHIAQERNKVNDDSTMKTFLDLYLIMDAEKSYLVQFGSMWCSQFPLLACKVAGREMIIRKEE